MSLPDLPLGREDLLLVARPDAFGLGQKPDLQQVHRLLFGGVELAVHDAGAGAHPLPLVRADDLAVAHAVAVLQPARDDVGQNLHVAVPVRAEALPRSDAVFVNHAQAPEAHVARVVVVAERESVVRVEPPVVGVPALAGRSQGNHRFVLPLCSRRPPPVNTSFVITTVGPGTPDRPRGTDDNIRVITTIVKRSFAPPGRRRPFGFPGRPPRPLPKSPLRRSPSRDSTTLGPHPRTG